MSSAVRGCTKNAIFNAIQNHWRKTLTNFLKTYKQRIFPVNLRLSCELDRSGLSVWLHCRGDGPCAGSSNYNSGSSKTSSFAHPDGGVDVSSAVRGCTKNQIFNAIRKPWQKVYGNCVLSTFLAKCRAPPFMRGLRMVFLLCA